MLSPDKSVLISEFLRHILPQHKNKARVTRHKPVILDHFCFSGSDIPISANTIEKAMGKNATQLPRHATLIIPNTIDKIPYAEFFISDHLFTKYRLTVKVPPFALEAIISGLSYILTNFKSTLCPDTVASHPSGR